MLAPFLPQLLAKDWHSLPFVIRRHYELQPNEIIKLKGDLSVWYPDLLWPVIALINLLGGLVLRRDNAIAIEVYNTAQDDVWLWQRTLTYSDGQQIQFNSHSTYSSKGGLVEKIGFGFGLKLQVKVKDAMLHYQSQSHFWELGKFRIVIPDWLLLGQAHITERALSDTHFQLDFVIRHPWWGMTYCYRGAFSYESNP